MIKLKVIIPAHNEEMLIATCLSALINGYVQKRDIVLEIVVVANACDDRTVENALKMFDPAASVGIFLKVIETPIPGKAHAINLAENPRHSDVYIYVDADVVCGVGMINALTKTLYVCDARYASGQIIPVSNNRFFSECYNIVWSNLPFVRNDVTGCGIYAVNAAGRQRWDVLPKIHSDDKFVRLQFTASERFKVSVNYKWPLPKSLYDLITVRSRWCRGNSELARKFPELLANDYSQSISFTWAMDFAVRHPISSTVFTLIYFAAKLRSLIFSDSTVALWERSR